MVYRIAALVWNCLLGLAPVYLKIKEKLRDKGTVIVPVCSIEYGNVSDPTMV
jgi:hypothetical protein